MLRSVGPSPYGRGVTAPAPAAPPVAVADGLAGRGTAAPSAGASSQVSGLVYVLHLEPPEDRPAWWRPVPEAHYVGWSTNFPRRLWTHQHARGSDRVHLAVRLGYAVVPALLLTGATPPDERLVQKLGPPARWCPICPAGRPGALAQLVPHLRVQARPSVVPERPARPDDLLTAQQRRDRRAARDLERDPA